MGSRAGRMEAVLSQSKSVKGMLQLEELRKQSGSSNTSLEDVFLTLVAEQEPAQ